MPGPDPCSAARSWVEGGVASPHAAGGSGGDTGDRPHAFRVSADLCPHEGEQNHHAALVGAACWRRFREDFKMGMLDQVIAAALGSRGQPPQGQSAQPAQDQFSQIAAALTALLAPSGGSGTETRPRNKAHPAASMFSSVSSSKMALRMSSTPGSEQGKTRQSRPLSSVKLLARRASTISHGRRAHRRMTCFHSSLNTYLASSTS